MSSNDDFEIRASLRAQRLTSHLVAAAATRSEAVTLARRGERSALPTPIEPEVVYENIVVETQVLARLDSDR